MDFASIGGIALAIIGILAGMLIEGGSIAQITQPTAAMIVVGGTMGAVMLQFPMNIFLAALKHLSKVFLHKGADGEAILQLLVSFANKARKSGIVSLDSDLASVEDPFLKQALMLAVDGTEPGIATAFVATIYGVAMANLICLPAAGKLKFRHREQVMIKEMMLEGVISIQEGMNPRMIETKLRTFLFDPKHEAPAKAAEATA